MTKKRLFKVLSPGPYQGMVGTFVGEPLLDTYRLNFGLGDTMCFPRAGLEPVPEVSTSERRDHDGFVRPLA